MVFNKWKVIGLALSMVMLLSAVSPASVFLLVDDRIEAQQRTEVRFDVPDGCLITGLGFRAHAGVMETMHLRYHRLSPDGQLVDPVEVKLGSQPDMHSEAAVYLPDGYVMVGFGAAGEPEWDVTLLRVWARPLLEDGTLGEIEVFNSGRNPTRGPEVYVLLPEPDRVITSAGARFTFHDVSSIYARSRRIIKVDARDTTAEKIAVQGWMLDQPDSDCPALLDNALQTYQPNRLDICWDADTPRYPQDNEIAILQALVQTAKAQSVAVHCWVPDADTAKVNQILEQVPELAGVVIDGDQLSDNQMLAALSEALTAADKSLAIRATTTTLPQLTQIPETVTIVVDEVGPETDLKHLGDRSVLLYMDLASRADLLNIRVEKIGSQIITSHLVGLDGYVARVDIGECLCLEAPHTLNLAALKQYSEDPLVTSNVVWTTICEDAYGESAELAENALRRTDSINEVLFSMLGNDVPFVGERFGTVPELLTKMPEHRLEAFQDANSMYFNAAEDEKLTATWLAIQSVWAVEAALEQHPEIEGFDVILGQFSRINQLIDLTQAAVLALVQAQIYFQDGSEYSLERVQHRLNNLQNEVANLQALSSRREPLLENVEAYIASIQDIVDRAPSEGVLPAIFQQANQLLEQGNKDQAFDLLLETLQNRALVQHLDKNNHKILEVLAQTEKIDIADNLQLLRGADGQWSIVEVDGHYGISTQLWNPCIYFKVHGEEFDYGIDHVLTFEFFDSGEGAIEVNYNADYRHNRIYHPARPFPRTDTQTWKTATILLSNALFTGRQNVGGDFRILPTTGDPLIIRNVQLSVQE